MRLTAQFATGPRNFVVNKVAASVIGTPAVNVNFVMLRARVNYFRSALIDQVEVTLLAVARANTPGQNLTKFMIGNFNNRG